MSCLTSQNLEQDFYLLSQNLDLLLPLLKNELQALQANKTSDYANLVQAKVDILKAIEASPFSNTQLHAIGGSSLVEFKAKHSEAWHNLQNKLLTAKQINELLTNIIQINSQNAKTVLNILYGNEQTTLYSPQAMTQTNVLSRSIGEA